MSNSKHHSIQPKSIRQKQILDIAAKNPSASLTEIAEEVPSASTDHVDRVLDQYGDPAADEAEDTSDSLEEHGSASSDGNSMMDTDSDEEKTATTGQDDESTKTGKSDDSTASKHTEQTDNATESDPPVQTESTGSAVNDELNASTSEGHGSDIDADETGSTTDEESSPDPDELTQKERETLRAICYDPDATQKQIADMLSVSRATVSNRVNAIPGFDWTERQTFVNEVFSDEVVVDSHGDSDQTPVETDPRNSSNQMVTDGASGTVSENSSGVTHTDIAGVDANSGVSNLNNSSPKGRDPSDTGTVPADEGVPVSHKIEKVSQRMAAIERAVTELDTTSDESLFDDAELVHKILYACMNSERVSEEEELLIIEELMD